MGPALTDLTGRTRWEAHRTGGIKQAAPAEGADQQKNLHSQDCKVTGRQRHRGKRVAAVGREPGPLCWSSKGTRTRSRDKDGHLAKARP